MTGGGENSHSFNSDDLSFLTSLADLAAEPFWKRHPKAVWRFFLAVAYRLSPWRRVLFAAPEARRRAIERAGRGP